MARPYERYMSQTGRERVPDILRELAGKVMGGGQNKFLNMAGGLPNADACPFVNLTVTLRDGTLINFGDETTKTAMQYCPSEGIKELRPILRDLVSHFHNPPCLNKPPEDGGTSIMVSAGSSDAIEKVFSMLLNRGDHLLTAEYGYPGAIAWMQTMRLKTLLLEMDGDGVKPDSLRQQLSRWTPADAKNPDSDIPKLIYLIPNGQNPTGSTLTLERKREIYKIAQEYDLLIFEDDPYYYLSNERVPSFLALDVDGRVIRAESFSKTLGAGLRCGYVAGPAPLMTKYVHHVQVSTNGSSTLSQVLIVELFKRWGMEGFEDHTKKIRAFYKERRDTLIAAAEESLKEYLEWDAPTGGMFLWAKSKHLEDTESLIYERVAERKVMFCAGNGFSPVAGTKSPYIRIAYSYCSTEEMQLACKTLAEVLQEEVDGK